jgi:hypothetical protein
MSRHPVLRGYSLYLGSAEQFKYTFHAKNQDELRELVREAWPTMFEGRWSRQPADGCPAGSKRFRVGPGRTPILIIPEKRNGN